MRKPAIKEVSLNLEGAKRNLDIRDFDINFVFKCLLDDQNRELSLENAINYLTRKNVTFMLECSSKSGSMFYSEDGSFFLYKRSSKNDIIKSVIKSVQFYCKWICEDLSLSNLNLKSAM